jgi:hypothetical protein
MAGRNPVVKAACGAILGAACAAASAATPVFQKPIESSSRIDFSIEATASSYTYRETDLAGAEFMRLEGPRGGIAARVTRSSDNAVFVAGELRLSYGKLDYRSPGSGTIDGIPDRHYELRALAGRRFDLGASVLAPYLGYGYRKLINDSEGLVSSLGDVGYYRISAYRYVPFGADWMIALGGTRSLSINAEYDYLIRGTQSSELPGDPIKNTQNRGWGARGSILYGVGRWSAGPYMEYWRIALSNFACGAVFCGVEPQNTTTEAGVRLRYSFE